MSPKWLGKCPSCNGWNCFAEELIVESGSDSRAEMRFDGKPLPIEDIPLTEGKRTVTDIAEVDRVLGGGIVGGSAILIGGEPGIGKSTLMLQMMHNLAQKGLKVLYVSGEESASQIKLRSDRIGAAAKNLYKPILRFEKAVSDQAIFCRALWMSVFKKPAIFCSTTLTCSQLRRI